MPISVVFLESNSYNRPYGRPQSPRTPQIVRCMLSFTVLSVYYRFIPIAPLRHHAARAWFAIKRAQGYRSSGFGPLPNPRAGGSGRRVGCTIEHRIHSECVLGDVRKLRKHVVHFYGKDWARPPRLAQPHHYARVVVVANLSRRHP